MFLAIFFLELVVLLFLARSLNITLYRLFYRLSHSEHIAIMGTTLLLFPGTVVHELAHLFTAEILGVHTGKLTLVPEYVEENRIQAGSVEVQKSDPFRRSIIGVAPLLVGIITITLISSYLTEVFPQVVAAVQTATRFQHSIIYLFLAVGYLLYAISNNMFPSKEDLHGVPPVLFVLAMIIGAAYALGARIVLTGKILEIYTSILYSLTTNLAVVIVLNLILLLLFQLILWILYSLFNTAKNAL